MSGEGRQQERGRGKRVRGEKRGEGRRERGRW